MIFTRPRQTIPQANTDIKIDNKSISQANVVKFLGVHMDSNMTWKTHLCKKSTQIAKVNGVLCKLKHQLPTFILKIIYNTLILPHIQYAITSWGNLKNSEIKRINILQKKSIRLICNAKYISHSEPLFKSLKLLKLNEIYQTSCCKLYHKNLKGLLPLYFKNELQTITDTHQYHTRQYNQIYAHNINQELSKQTINYKIAICWNQLPDAIFQYSHYSTKSFSKRLKHHFLSIYSQICDKQQCYICEPAVNQ